jgi:hypothetical protein
VDLGRDPLCPGDRRNRIDYRNFNAPKTKGDSAQKRGGTRAIRGDEQGFAIELLEAGCRYGLSQM